MLTLVYRTQPDGIDLYEGARKLQTLPDLVGLEGEPVEEDLRVMQTASSVVGPLYVNPYVQTTERYLLSNGVMRRQPDTYIWLEDSANPDSQPAWNEQDRTAVPYLPVTHPQMDTFLFLALHAPDDTQNRQFLFRLLELTYDQNARFLLEGGGVLKTELDRLRRANTLPFTANTDLISSGFFARRADMQKMAEYLFGPELLLMWPDGSDDLFPGEHAAPNLAGAFGDETFYTVPISPTAIDQETRYLVPSLLTRQKDHWLLKTYSLELVGG